LESLMMPTDEIDQVLMLDHNPLWKAGRTGSINDVGQAPRTQSDAGPIRIALGLAGPLQCVALKVKNRNCWLVPGQSCIGRFVPQQDHW
jgi:hypothetical protein